MDPTGSAACAGASRETAMLQRTLKGRGTNSVGALLFSAPRQGRGGQVLKASLIATP